MNTHQKRVIDYYKNFESRWGYSIFTWDTKHFGYYPSKINDISEKKAQRLMMDLLAKKLEIRKNDLILDAGCGRGTTSCYLAEKYGARMISIDIVDFELDIARNKTAELNLTNKVNFYLRDYSNTKFDKDYFNKIFTLETLVHSPDIAKTLKEFHRILKPGGRLVLFEYSKAPPGEFSRWEQKIIEIISEGSAMTSLARMTHGELPILIRNAGFNIISDEDIADYMLPSLKRFNDYAIIPYQFIKLFNLQKYFINTTAGVEFYRMVKKGLIQYRVIVARKDGSNRQK